MDASQLFKSGNLAEAIDAQIAVVQGETDRPGARLFLFEFARLRWRVRSGRAAKSMRSSTTSPISSLAVAEIKRVVEAERLRRLVFGKKAQPELLAPPPDHVRLRLLGLMKLGRTAPRSKAADAFQQANSQIPNSKGSLNGKPFDGFRDGDDWSRLSLGGAFQGALFLGCRSNRSNRSP